MNQNLQGEYNMGVPRPEKGKSYTEQLRKIYHSNKDIIGILAHWRRIFRIRSRGLDRGLAYLFEKIRQQHTIRWKSVINRMLRDIINKPHFMPSMIGFMMYSHYSKDIEKELQALEEAGLGEKKRRTKKNMLAGSKESEELFKEAMEAGKKLEVHGVPNEYLPEWYFVSGHEFPLYHDDWIKPFLAQAKEREMDLLQKERDLLRLLRNSRYSCWPEFFDKLIAPPLSQLERDYKEKMTLCQIESIHTLKALEHDKEKVDRIIQKQLRFVTNVNHLIDSNKKAIPDKANFNSIITILKNYRTLLSAQQRTI